MVPRETITLQRVPDSALPCVVVGSAALGLLGVTTRQTRDCDVLHPGLPEAILTAARTFAKEQRLAETLLRDDWLNNGPTQLTDVLPSWWKHRFCRAYRGEAVVLQTLGRADLLTTKLFALCDRGADLSRMKEHQ